MSARQTVDVSGLPTFAFGHRQLTWWCTLSLILMEGGMFVVLFGAYFFLRTPVPQWPPGVGYPQPFWGTVNLVLILLSCVPNYFQKRAAESLDLRGVRIWIAVLIVFALVATAIRFVEFGYLNCRWDQNAYGSAVWVIMGTHLLHLITDALDSIVLLALMLVGPVEGKRFVDVSENALYWYFVVGLWVPTYVVVYWVPRWI
ncbi:MAG TPA: cytochrome c oxidase subunit 3 [Pyrinomonadaceae bacterium]|nr:cytochrome c oxidase subunit 3 [Pyrinomonadaceae bacterium]